MFAPIATGFERSVRVVRYTQHVDYTTTEG
jgi:hypothetical protein